jgi:TRAP-type C4-dicarboxylate transport system substrate-binding protein
MTRRTAVAFFIIAVLLANAAAALAPTTWAMPTDYPQDSMPGQGLTTFAQRLAADSGGRLNVTPVFDGAAGFKAGDVLAAISNGKIPGADVFGGVAGERDPLLLLPSLPFVTSSVGDARRLFGVAQPTDEAAFERMGLKLLYVTPWPPSGIWAKVPIRTPDDLRGLRIRTYDATSEAVMNALGAQATSLSFGEAMPLIKGGSIDAVLSSGDGGAGRKLWEYFPVYTKLEYAFPLSFTVLSKPVWDALDADLRRAVSQAAFETQAAQWTSIETRLASNELTMRANGVTIVSDNSPELRRRATEAAVAAVESWKMHTGADGRAILARYAGR